MAVTVTSVSPFFEPGAPPPTMPLLTTHTEFRESPNTPLTAQELPPAPSRNKVVRFTSSAAGSTAATPPSRMSPADGDDNSSTGSSFGDSDDRAGDTTDDEDLSDDGLIPKPDGENGRRNRGGYNLELALGWDSRAFHKLKVFVHKCADKRLDTSVSYSYQALAALRDVRSLAAEQFPYLEHYRDLWPVDDILRLRLKNTSAKQRRQERQKAAAQVLDSVSKINKARSRRGKAGKR